MAAAIAAIDVPTDGPFGVRIGTDDKNPEAYSVNIGQSGLGLPDRDYYLKDTKEFADIRAALSPTGETMPPSSLGGG